MIKVKDIAQALEAWAPPPIAESYDNVGLLVGYPQMNVTGVLINLDMTEAVVEEAVSLGINMIVAHHPIWFSARKRLNGEDYVSRTIISAIKHDIALYACHTNLDNIRAGVNRRIADTLGLQGLDFLRSKPSPSGIEDYGSGMIGSLPDPMTKQSFLKLVSAKFHAKGIRYADANKSTIHKVAVCGGSGSFLIGEALRQGADAFVTADITYHKYFDNEGAIMLLDIGHYESEQFTSALILEFLSEKFSNFVLRLSQVYTNPVRYFS